MTDETFQSINPLTGESIGVYVAHTDAQLEALLERSRAAFLGWRRTSFEDRADLLRRMAQLLTERREALATLATDEMGKPLVEARAEVDKCALVCEHYATHGAQYLEPRHVTTDATLSLVRYDPLGTVLAVMPWNFPFWQLFRVAAPTLMGGGVLLLKHASNTMGCAAAIEALIEEASGGAGLLLSLRIGSERVARIIVDHRVRAVTLTGSTRAGRAVARIAGGALKPCVLELGGADPFIVLEDADIDAASKAGARSRLINSGQSCIAAKRFIVAASVHDAFVQKLREAMDKGIMGDPREEGVTLGPLARAELRDGLHEQVMRSVKDGARQVCGGQVPAREGCFYPPTILTDVRPGMAAFDEELFGPVAAVIRARDTAHAVELANQSELGLGASLWTQDLKLALELVPQLEAGHVAINGMVKSDPRLPFGGVKGSGTGRELSEEGARAMMNVKAVWMA